MNDVNEQESFIPHGHRGKVLFNCNNCKDHGAVIATQRGEFALYAFTCRCAAGDRSKRAFPQWPGEQAGWDIAA